MHFFFLFLFSGVFFLVLLPFCQIATTFLLQEQLCIVIMAMLFLAPAALAFAIGATQAVDELGASFSPAPTKAPSMELVKAKMGKRAATNICTEWTISGIGRPQCSSSQTCIFQTIDDYFYEGCGLADVNYDWITDCYNYPSTGATPSSELYW